MHVLVFEERKENRMWLTLFKIQIKYKIISELETDFI